MAKCQNLLKLRDGYMRIHGIISICTFGNTAKEVFFKTDEFMCIYFVNSSTQKRQYDLFIPLAHHKIFATIYKNYKNDLTGGFLVGLMTLKKKKERKKC